jgi:hypothetical protein
MAKTVVGETGLPQTNVLFYTTPDKASLVSDIENSVIDSVSLGVLSEHALCSECGFDYFGDDASPMNFWDRTCPEGHTIGEDGVHLNLTGVDGVYELSLVSTGAVQNSKIVSGSKAVVGAASTQRLAASGVDPCALILRASGTLPKSPAQPKESLMADAAQFEGLVEKLTTARVDLATTTTKLEASVAEVATLKEQIASLTTENTDLKAKQANPEEMPAKLAAVTAELDSLKVFLSAQAKKAVAATNGDVATVEAMSLSQMTTVITEAQTKLATLFPAGGATLTATTTEDAEAADKAARRASFKTPR